MSEAGMNMALVGNRNRATILYFINKKGSASRKEIAEATGLTAAAVTQISQGLIKDGVLVETGQLSGTGAGRKQVILNINYDCRYVFSVNIEQTHTVLALCNMKGDAVKTVKMDTDTETDAEQFLNKVAARCKKILEGLEPDMAKKVSGISVGIPGLVNCEKGSSVHAYGIWEKEVEVCRILSSKLQLPCYIANNVNAFAQASSLYGIGRNYNNMLVVKWGPGVGGTILVDNRVYDGRHGKAAELGHYIVRKNGPVCNCGRRGCLETFVSYPALNHIVPFEEGGFAKAYEAAEDRQKQAIEDAVDMFARGLTNTVTVLAPDRVILCGFMFREERTRALLIEKVREYDTDLADRRILYTSLSQSEEYIGPVAAYVRKVLE